VVVLCGIFMPIFRMQKADKKDRSKKTKMNRKTTKMKGTETKMKRIEQSKMIDKRIRMKRNDLNT
jgi:hypothetical protein